MRDCRRNNPTIFLNSLKCYVNIGYVSKYEIKNIGYQARKGDNGDPIFICGYC